MPKPKLMLELSVRLVACVVMAILGLAQITPLAASWQAAMAVGALSVLAWWLDERARLNPGVAGFIAVGEAGALAYFLRAAEWHQTLGFLVLLPCALAAAFRGAPLVSMAPLAATSLVVADATMSRSGVPDPRTLAHAAVMLAIALVLGYRRAIPAVEPVERDAPQMIEDGAFQIRENYRKLRAAYQDLESRARRDRIAARICACGDFRGRAFYIELCQAVRELTGASQVAVYTVGQFGDSLVVRGVTEDYPQPVRDQMVAVDLSKAPALIRQSAEAALRAATSGLDVASSLMLARGKVLGLLVAAPPHPNRDEETRARLEEIAPYVASAVDAEIERAFGQGRVRELELLYELSSVSTGSSTPAGLAARVVRELGAIVDVDALSVVLFDDDREIILASHGPSMALVEGMTFANGPGVKGWLDLGAPELSLYDARLDPRCDPRDSLERRVGAYFLAPLWSGLAPIGYLSAATHVAGGIDRGDVASLRLATHELCRALERVDGEMAGGLMTPREFSNATAHREGRLVYFEILRREELVAAHGASVVDIAARKLANLIRAQLPPEAALCRRDQNDFLAFLPTDDEFARRWANDVSAGACLIGIATEEAGRWIPLALRARVAAVNPQSREASSEIAA